MFFYPTERIALFIDGANLYATAKALGFDIDYKNLLGVFRSKGYLVRALYYTALVEDQEYSSIRPLIDWLDYNGYTMVTKPARGYTDSTGRRRFRTSMDVELAVDAMRLADKADHIILFSGEQSFTSLVSALQQMGKRVTVISTIETQPAMVADELRRQADHFIDIDSLQSQIARVGRTPRTAPAEREERFRRGFGDEDRGHPDNDHDEIASEPARRTRDHKPAVDVEDATDLDDKPAVSEAEDDTSSPTAASEDSTGTTTTSVVRTARRRRTQV